jgi:hypothetical protein
MRRALSAGAGIIAILALAGCGKISDTDSAPPVTYEPSLGGALGATGGLLLIPFAVAVALWIVWGFDRWNSPRTEEELVRAKWALASAGFILGVILVLWLAAVWSGLAGN